MGMFLVEISEGRLLSAGVRAAEPGPGWDPRQFEEEVEGISRWMREVEAFLAAEDPAVGDRATLEAQLKESNALQDDIATLSPNVQTINETGQQLLSKCAPTENFR